jgi:DegV family protein with EDD domain
MEKGSMGKVAIITDSTAFVSPKLMDGLPIHIMPLHLTWNGQSFDDGVDIQPAEFFDRLKKDEELPKTSQISTQEFINSYKQLLDQGYEILSIHLSSKLSGTFNAAFQAVKELATNKISLVDSFSGAAALAFMVLQSAKAAVSGASLKECTKVAENVREHSNIYFVPGTLDFLYRGGRIGGAAAFFGSVLQIKPILKTRGGIIDAVEKVRTMSRAMQRVVELVGEEVGDSPIIQLAGLYADIPELATTLLEIAKNYLGIDRVVDTFLSTISPVLGTYIGTGSVGLAFMYSDEPFN